MKYDFDLRFQSSLLCMKSNDFDPSLVTSINDVIEAAELEPVVGTVDYRTGQFVLAYKGTAERHAVFQAFTALALFVSDARDNDDIDVQVSFSFGSQAEAPSIVKPSAEPRKRRGPDLPTPSADQIVALLNEKGSLTFTQVARELNTSRNKTRAVMERLQNQGVLFVVGRHYSVQAFQVDLLHRPD